MCGVCLCRGRLVDSSTREMCGAVSAMRLCDVLEIMQARLPCGVGCLKEDLMRGLGLKCVEMQAGELIVCI